MIQAKSRIALLQRLSQDTAPARPAPRPDANGEKWWPLRRFRLCSFGRQSRAAPPVPRLMMSYHSAQAAEFVAGLLRQNCPESTFEVQDAGADALQSVNHFTGEIRDVSAGEWQFQWPHIPLPEDYVQRPARGRKLKSQEVAHAAQ